MDLSTENNSASLAQQFKDAAQALIVLQQDSATNINYEAAVSVLLHLAETNSAYINNNRHAE